MLSSYPRSEPTDNRSFSRRTTNRGGLIDCERNDLTLSAILNMRDHFMLQLVDSFQGGSVLEVRENCFSLAVLYIA